MRSAIAPYLFTLKISHHFVVPIKVPIEDSTCHNRRYMSNWNLLQSTFRTMTTIPYCLNIHPGESLAALRQAITTHALAVKVRLSPTAPYPLGLRLTAAAANELSDPSTLEEFVDLLSTHDLYTTCVNGFPYGAFHDTTVKAAVYQPDWSTPERLNYTARLAKIMVRLTPADHTANISTVPLAYRRDPTSSGSDKSVVYARQLALLAEFLEELQEESGREVIMAIEPEPDCLLESCDETIAWFEDQLLYEGRRWLSAGSRRSRESAEELLRRKIGICLDTCHFAVAFEDPLTTMIRFESAGLRIARVQLSSAISTTISASALARLRDFFDPVYLHQTKIQLPYRRLLALPDLDETTIATAAQHLGCELRTHFHVPLFFAGDDTLSATNRDLTPALFAHIQQKGYPMEIETYTFNILPPALRAGSVVENLIKEHEWVAQKVGVAMVGRD